MMTSRTNPRRLSMLWWIGLSLLTFLQAVFGSSTSTNNNDELEAPMVGGFRRVDPDDDSIFAAATLAMKEAVDTTAYGFIVDAVGSFGTKEETVSALSFVVVDAKEQVVAGKNYRLSIMVMRQNDDDSSSACVGVNCCLGAFSVVVYDRWGDMQVTEWLDEVSCVDAFELLLDNKDTPQFPEQTGSNPIIGTSNEAALEAETEVLEHGESETTSEESVVAAEAAAEAAQTVEEHH